MEYPSYIFSSPSMCKGVNDGAPDFFNRSVNARTNCIATNDTLAARRVTHPIVSELSLNSATRAARNFGQTSSITSHRISNPAWFCKNDIDLLNLFNKNSPLPNQASWTVFSPSNTGSMKVISVLRMQHFEMGEWLQLKKAGKYVRKLVLLCQTFGSESLATGCNVPAAS